MRLLIVDLDGNYHAEQHQAFLLLIPASEMAHLTWHLGAWIHPLRWHPDFQLKL